jgi:protein TonB
MPVEPATTQGRAVSRTLALAAAILVHVPIVALIWMRDVRSPPPAPGMQAILVDIVKTETPPAKQTVPKSEPEKPAAAPAARPAPLEARPPEPRPLPARKLATAPARSHAAEAALPSPAALPSASSSAAAAPGGVAPSGASEAGIGVATAKATYIDELKSWLAAHKQYPRAARRMRIEGDAVLWFKLDRGGHVVAHRLEKSSGSDILDREVEAMLARAEPMPAPPEKLAGSALEYSFPIRFRIDDGG